MSVILAAELRPPFAVGDALVEADRCLGCGEAHAPAPCMVACPATVDVPSFVGAIAEGDTDDASRTILAANLLGGTCARVCPVEVLCQGACVLEQPIEIARLQRFALDRSPASPLRLRPRAAATGRHVAVVGAGPAGMACAGELALRGHDVTLYDERRDPGGLARYAIAPYRIELEPLPQELGLLHDLGVTLAFEHPVGRGELLHLIEHSDAVFLGIGAGPDSAVAYPGDDLEGVWDSLAFIEQLKTDSPPDVGSRVVVVGGGNTAMDVAREALRLGADDVTLLYRRTRREMPAYPHEVEETEAEGVHFQWLATPTRLLGDGRLEAVECRLMTLGTPDESGRRRPEPLEGSEFVLAADTLVRAIGQAGHRELGDLLELDGGVLAVDEHWRTSNPKVFAGGDAVNGGASAVEAVRAGRDAAIEIDRWLA